MTLPKNTNFETTDPEALRTDLQLEHADVRDELARIDDANADKWSVVLVADAQVVRAAPFTAYAGVTFTLMTPGKPRPGDVFRVITRAAGAVSIGSDDGALIHGSASDSIGGGAHGWFEWQWVTSPDPLLQGWWRSGG